MQTVRENSAHDKLGQVSLSPSEKSTLKIKFSGAWVGGSRVIPVATVIGELMAGQKPVRVMFESTGLESWDSRLVTFLIKIIDHCRTQGIEVDQGGLPDGVRGLLRLAYAVPERAGARRKQVRTALVEDIGKAVLKGWNDAKELNRFIGEVVLSGGTLLQGKARFRAIDLVVIIQEAGPGALAIVTLISLLVGLILAFVGAVQLAMFGAQIYIADLVGLGMVREMGALMTAIIMAGRTGAAYAAQLGSMNVNSEIDALKTMGISPMEFLVLPRMLALILMMPLLGLYADFTGMLGGALVTVSFFDISLIQYFNETTRSVHLTDFVIGIVKCAVFAVLIATAGCLRGMQCGRSASAVGDATTTAVVNSIVYIVVADSLITLICNRFGI